MHPTASRSPSKVIDHTTVVCSQREIRHRPTATIGACSLAFRAYRGSWRPTLERLTDLDAALLAAETPNQHVHIIATLILDMSGTSESPYQVVLQRMRERFATGAAASPTTAAGALRPARMGRRGEGGTRGPRASGRVACWWWHRRNRSVGRRSRVSCLAPRPPAVGSACDRRTR